MGIKNSQGMCRVVTSNEDIIADPELELTKILRGLEGCGLPKQSLDKTHVRKFFDSSLQHGNNRANQCIKNAEAEHILENFVSESGNLTQRWLEESYYLKAVELYCDMK